LPGDKLTKKKERRAMFARLTIFQIREDKIDEAIKLYKESVVPEAKLQKGYKGVYLLADQSTGNGISMTLWESEADAVANEENLYYQEQLVKFLNLFKSPPVREGYQVSVQALANKPSHKKGVRA
jgi:heme-degrading monooxygenase HmoA